MCDCLAWNPLWATIAREARVRRSAVVLAILYLRSAPDQPQARSALVIGAVVGMRPETLGRLLAALRAHEVIDDDNEPVGAWAVTRDVTASHRPMTGAERQAKYRAKCRAAAGKSAAAVLGDGPSPNVTPSQTPSFSLFPISEEKKENKQPRTRGDAGDDGFAELARLWPLDNRMADAALEYRRALRDVDRSRLFEAAQRYLDGLGTRYCMFLGNWLRTKPWRDPLLPLAAPLRAVVADDPPRVRIEWRVHAETWLRTRAWPPNIGPPPDDPGCQVPEGLLQTTLQRAKRQHDRERAYG